MMIWRQTTGKSAGRLLDRYVRGRRRAATPPVVTAGKVPQAAPTERPGEPGPHLPSKSA